MIVLNVCKHKRSPPVPVLIQLAGIACCSMEVIVTARVAEFVFKGWCLLTRTSALSENFFIMSCSMKHLGQEGLGLIGRMLKEPCKDRKQFPVVSFILKLFSAAKIFRD